ncbi:MAG: phage tail tube protein [Candidatus Ornithomonoglobus sp.]
MGLPEILIEFKAKAETAIRRSSNGTVAVILADDMKSGEGNLSYSYATASDYGLSSSWSTTNRRYLNLIFAGSPTERVQLKSCWLDELTLQAFENGKLAEDEFSGGFTGFTYLDDIADPCI